MKRSYDFKRIKSLLDNAVSILCLYFHAEIHELSLRMANFLSHYLSNDIDWSVHIIAIWIKGDDIK